MNSCSYTCMANTLFTELSFQPLVPVCNQLKTSNKLYSNFWDGSHVAKAFELQFSSLSHLSAGIADTCHWAWREFIWSRSRTSIRWLPRPQIVCLLASKYTFWDRFSLYSLGWPGAHHVEQTDPELLLSSAASGSPNAEISGMHRPTPSWFSGFHLCT